MRFREQNEEEAVEINLTPLIDVVFLLLIFFMVSTTFSKETQLHIKLPEATATAQPEDQSKELEIDISASGMFAIKGPADKEARQLLQDTPQALRRALKAAMGEQSDLLVVVRADRKTPHEAVIRALDASRRLGLSRVTFATQQAVAGEKSQ
jgi:biopolymer transport protein ExbD